MVFEAETDRPDVKFEQQNGKYAKKYYRNGKHSDVIWVRCKYAPACKEIYKEKSECITENSQ
jgi:hypothetical protein